jgi:glucose-1-phosphate adenylyltransferase
VKRTLAFIMAGGKGERLYPLTEDRAKPAVPFGGKYRIIDFTLSNCLNSNLRKINVLTQYKSYSLHMHIRLGWDYFRSVLGEYICVIPAQKIGREEWYLGTADAIYQNIYFIDKEKPERVLILSGDHIYKMDYQDMVIFHKIKRADLTIATVEMERKKASQFGIIQIDKNQKVTGFQEKPKEPKPVPGRPDFSLVSMGVYIFNTDILKKELIEDAKRTDSTHDFGKDVIPNMINKANAYSFIFRDRKTGKPKYWRDVGKIDTYWEANMDLIGIDPKFNLYDKDWPIYTLETQSPPAKTIGIDENRAGLAISSLLADGCLIVGGKVFNSIISNDVIINEGNDVSYSILFEDVELGKNCKIKKAIVDSHNKIPPNTVIGYNLSEDKNRFTVSKGGVVVVPSEYYGVRS